MKCYAVPDRYLISHDQGIFPPRDVKDASVLDICSPPDPDVIDVATNYCVEPYTAFIADCHIADHLGAIYDIGR
jgi:hypothetical protein